MFVDKATHTHARGEGLESDEEFLLFEGSIQDMALKYGAGGDEEGGALSKIKALVPSDLFNAARNLLRARGARAHPILAGRCRLVLSSLEAVIMAALAQEEAVQGKDDAGGSMPDFGVNKVPFEEEKEFQRLDAGLVSPEFYTISSPKSGTEGQTSLGWFGTKVVDWADAGDSESVVADVLQAKSQQEGQGRPRRELKMHPSDATTAASEEDAPTVVCNVDRRGVSHSDSAESDDGELSDEEARTLVGATALCQKLVKRGKGLDRAAHDAIKIAIDKKLIDRANWNLGAAKKFVMQMAAEES